MTFPAGLTLVSVHGRVDALPSGGASGQACFTRPYALVGGADNSIVPPRPEYATLSATGEFTILLPATNDPDWTPVNWAYSVEIVSSSGVIRGTLQLNYLATSVELADLIQIDGTASSGTSYIPLSARGAALGVAALDVDGDVNNAAGVKITGTDEDAVHLTGNESVAGVKTFISEPVAPSYKATGTTGAPNSGRFVGVTTAAAPTSGTYAISDFVVSQNGQMFVCTAAGTPGTWVNPRDTTNLVTTGEETLSRELAIATTAAAVSQTMRLSYFTARKTETTTQVRVYTSTIAAGATPTVCRIGLYTIAANGDGTLVASVANDTTLFAAAPAAYTRSWSSPYAKIAGQRYALGILVVSAAAIPNFLGQVVNSGAEALVAPAVSAALAAQADLPGSFAAGSLATTGNRPYGVVLP